MYAHIHACIHTYIQIIYTLTQTNIHTLNVIIQTMPLAYMHACIHTYFKFDDSDKAPCIHTHMHTHMWP
jgi:hypothetical protein